MEIKTKRKLVDFITTEYKNSTSQKPSLNQKLQWKTKDIYKLKLNAGDGGLMGGVGVAEHTIQDPTEGVSYPRVNPMRIDARFPP